VSLWRAFVDLIESRSVDGSFARAYPLRCPDRPGIIGTDSTAMTNAIQAHIPELGDYRHLTGPYSQELPSPSAIMDLLEFAFDKIATPTRTSSHVYFYEPHAHFEEFNVSDARTLFRDEVNTLLSRNGLAYEMQDGGDIVRLGPSGLREQLERTLFDTGDGDLNRILEDARHKFLDPDPNVRREALKSIWDAWERVKTLEVPDNKPESIKRLLDAASSSRPQFRLVLENNARQLTNAGNVLMIRHSEMDREAVTDSAQIDYLFHTLFAMIQLVLRASHRLAQ
jgi:hypothetical protein